jgi:hypothetical protein
MISVVGTFTFVVGVVVSFLAGMAYAITKRAFSDYTKTKELIPGMRKTAWSSVWTTIKAAALAVIIFAVLIGWIVSEQKGH